MTRVFDASKYAFRNKFVIPDKDVLQWFPGHMAKGMAAMQHKLRSVDCVIEVHDARIPISGRNPRFKRVLCGTKPHILVLNKKDLSASSHMPYVRRYFEREGTPILYTNCKDQMDKGIKQLMPIVQDMILNSERYNRSDIKEYCCMIIGVPNVGKSSLINMLRHKYLKRGSATRVGGVPGITKSVLTRIKISDEPLFYMFDTPGIIEPVIKDVNMGLKLALCATLQDHLIGVTVIADYLLYWLNKYERFQYVDLMGLKEPSDDISEVLTGGALTLKKFIKIRQLDTNHNKLMPDLHYAANEMIRAFRTGELGKIFLDVDLIDREALKDKKEDTDVVTDV